MTPFVGRDGLTASDPNNGQYSCVNACPEGTPTACGSSCVDLQTNVLHCGKCDQECPDVANGQPTCVGGMCAFTCNNGFMSNGTSCVDVDECATNTDDCDPNATCVNTPGSFGCLCNTGYTGNGRTCTDVDECALNTDNCDPNATCANTPGSFTCTCASGYIGNGSFCADINECADGLDNCDVNATCTNTPGSFDCNCNMGYLGNGVMCTDIDECVTGVNNCMTPTTCVNTPGSFICDCLAPNALCNGVCKNLDADPMNCGMCGTTCNANQQCVNGTCVGTGNLQLTLTWNVPADLDLHLINPSGKHIYYSNKGPSLATDFGQLDVDDIGGTGPENIFWATANTPPTGTYLVCVNPYNVSQPTTYSLIIKRPGHPDINLSGTRSVSNNSSACDMASPNFVTSFTYP